MANIPQEYNISKGGRRSGAALNPGVSQGVFGRLATQSY
jgi:hypothetical protein